MDGATAALEATLRALADPKRRLILEVVRTDAKSVGDIAVATDMSQQATSHHLRVLRDADLLDEDRVGTRHLFVVRRDGFAAVQAYLSSFWPDRLQLLKRAAEETARRQRPAQPSARGERGG